MTRRFILNFEAELQANAAKFKMEIFGSTPID
jgi:hypothetical protein